MPQTSLCRWKPHVQCATTVRHTDPVVLPSDATSSATLLRCYILAWTSGATYCVSSATLCGTLKKGARPHGLRGFRDVMFVSIRRVPIWHQAFGAWWVDGPWIAGAATMVDRRTSRRRPGGRNKRTVKFTQKAVSVGFVLQGQHRPHKGRRYYKTKGLEFDTQRYLTSLAKNPSSPTPEVMLLQSMSFIPLFGRFFILKFEF